MTAGAAPHVGLAPAPGSGPPVAPGRPPRYLRRADGRLVAGVCAGLAEHLRVSVLAVRVAFVLLAGIGGFGVVLYVALWAVRPVAEVEEAVESQLSAPAGIAAAARSGYRQGRGLRGRAGDAGQLVAFLALGAGLALLLQQTDLGVSGWWLWPLVIVAVGLALVWQQADDAERATFATAAPRAPWVGAVLGTGRFATAVRIVAGAAVVALGLAAFLAGQGQLRAAVDGLVGTAVVLSGLALVLGPWLWRLWRTLESERRERIVSQERADVAAHLHDSVLQTLALIQKQAEDPRTVARLARAQERDLRAWLYGSTAPPDTSLRAALERAAAEVDDVHGVPVDVVAVGDTSLDEPVRVVLAAAREAMVNAAKHSGADRVDVYAEVDGAVVEVFVRDRGHGFDLDSVPPDRLGVRRSIVGRMHRHGGRATVRSTPGQGTEVHLRLGPPPPEPPGPPPSEQRRPQ